MTEEETRLLKEIDDEAELFVVKYSQYNLPVSLVTAIMLKGASLAIESDRRDIAKYTGVL